jgi:hypothetical protein
VGQALRTDLTLSSLAVLVAEVSDFDALAGYIGSCNSFKGLNNKLSLARMYNSHLAGDVLPAWLHNLVGENS